MNPAAQHLRETLEMALPLLRQMTDDAASLKLRPEKWSPKEILGHLIDSASNNQHKFVRTMQAEAHTDFVGYQQNFWVEAQQYNAANWSELVDLWYRYNRHLAHVIEKAPAEKLDNTISIDGSGPYTLRFILSDYGEHLKHHLKQILPDAGFVSNFENLYNA